MYPKRMAWVEIYLMRSDMERTLDAIHESRIIQSMKTSKGAAFERGNKKLELRNRTENIVDFLGPFEEKEKGLLSGFFSEPPKRMKLPQRDIDKVFRSWLDRAEKKVLPLKRRMDGLEDDLAYIDEIIDRLTPFTGLEVDLQSLSSLKMTRARIGTTRRYEELSKGIFSAGGMVKGSLLDKKEGVHSVCVFYPLSSKERVRSFLRGRYFSEVNIDIGELRSFLEKRSGDTSMLSLPILGFINGFEKFRTGLEREMKGLSNTITKTSSSVLNEARGWHEYIGIELEKDDFAGNTLSTRYTNRISGWVEKGRLRELETLLDSSTGDRHHISWRRPTRKEIEENQVPTKQENGSLGTLFESMTNTFSPPKYNEIDPSLWISVPFIVFFGLMLGDIGYGLIILFSSIFILKKTVENRFMKTVGYMGALMGITTTLAGLWMGSFFGDLVPRLILGDSEGALYSLTIFGVNLPYDTLRNPMVLFQISLYIGLAQLNIGLFLLGYDRYRKKEYFGVVKGAVSWLFIQLAGTIFIGSLIVGWFELNQTLSMIGGASFITGAVLLFFESKGMFFFDIEGFLGDWISYTRILALGLSTFGLAMAFNIIGEMLFDLGGIVMVIVVVPLLLILHVFNLLLQTLGSVVHSLRLQFVEFFGRFYEGGGHLFEPFGRERTYTLSGSSETLDRGGGR